MSCYATSNSNVPAKHESPHPAHYYIRKINVATYLYINNKQFTPTDFIIHNSEENQS